MEPSGADGRVEALNYCLPEKVLLNSVGKTASRLLSSNEGKYCHHNSMHQSAYFIPLIKRLYDLWEESKKVRLQINPLKTEEIRVNTVINQGLRLNGEDITRSSEFCYLGGVVTEKMAEPIQMFM